MFYFVHNVLALRSHFSYGISHVKSMQKDNLFKFNICIIRNRKHADMCKNSQKEE